MFYGFLLLLWLVVTLLTMGVVCFMLTLLYCILPLKIVHDMMWQLYVNWVLMLGWFVRKLVPSVEVETHGTLPENKPYILISNHYSWLDILILYATIFTRKRNFVFVMKRSLIYLPFIGVICWGVGHPLIERGRTLHTRNKLSQAVNKALKYQYGMMIFPEGSRLTKKMDLQPNECLLKPKRSGFQIVASAFGEEIEVVDCTLVYQDKRHTVSDFLMGKIGRVKLISESIQLQSSEGKEWIRHRWVLKERLLSKESAQLRDSD